MIWLMSWHQTEEGGGAFPCLGREAQVDRIGRRGDVLPLLVLLRPPAALAPPRRLPPPPPDRPDAGRGEEVAKQSNKRQEKNVTVRHPKNHAR